MHPMCLWAAARSYVRPALAPDVWNKQPYFDRGTSLFNIDLRSNTATFHWSPSAQEQVTEGVFSISGIMTDWYKEQTVWVSSTSAGKIWEIDARMTCQAINSWSLPTSCDEMGAVIPANGSFGEGTLFTQPSKEYYCNESNFSPPILNVDKTPGAFGLHIYQRPLNRPRFQTRSLECIDAPGFAVFDKSSISTSSIFALPDTSDRVFTCGIATSRIPLSQLFSSTDRQHFSILDNDSHALCVLTLTNKGDIYSHALLESSDGVSKHLNFVDLPLGTKAIGIPEGIKAFYQDKSLRRRKPTKGMNLLLRLGNEYPLPGSFIQPPAPKLGKKKYHKFNEVKYLTTSAPISRAEKEQPSAKVEPQQMGLNVAKVGQSEEPSRYAQSYEIPATYEQRAKSALQAFSDRLRTKSLLKTTKNEDLAEADERVDEDLKSKKSDLTSLVLQLSSEVWNKFEKTEFDGDQSVDSKSEASRYSDSESSAGD